MEKQYIDNPFKLENKGYEVIEEHSTDTVRWVFCLKKKQKVSYHFFFRIVYLLTISDNPSVKTNDNFEYSYERIELAVTNDSNAEMDDLYFIELSIDTLKSLEKFIEIF